MNIAKLNILPHKEVRSRVKEKLIVLVVIVMALIGMAGAANYMYEKATVKGVGYKNVEIIAQTGYGFAGSKLVEKESGSGNVILERTELEVDRTGRICQGGNNGHTETGNDSINFTKEAEFEYMPVSYQTGTYDQKWIEKLCVQNYEIGAVVTEQYTHAEHLQKTTEVKTIGGLASAAQPLNGDSDCICNGTLEANFNSNVIGVAHIGWLSKDTTAASTGRHTEYGRSVEDLTGVFSIEKFIQLWDNNTCDSISVDWLPCI
jgi:hypothetical protein